MKNNLNYVQNIEFFRDSTIFRGFREIKFAFENRELNESLGKERKYDEEG